MDKSHDTPPSRRKKRRVSRTAVAVLALLVLAGLGYVYRNELALAAIKIAAQRRTPVGPHQTIEWDRGPTQPAAPLRMRRFQVEALLERVADAAWLELGVELDQQAEPFGRRDRVFPPGCYGEVGG